MATSTPIPCRYYNLLNAGIGIIIWPEIRDATNPSGENPLWDGRNHDGWSLDINESNTVDLVITCMPPGTTFILAENTMFGTDMWDSSQVFSFDPTSTITACAVKHGGVDDGSLTYSGIKSSAPEAKRTLAVAPMAKQFSAYADVVSHQRLKDFIATAFPESSGPMTSGDDNNVSGIVGNPQGWNAIVKWLAGSNPNVVLAGSGVIVYAMIQKGYKATYHEVQKADGTVEVDFGIQPGQGGGEILGDVPPKVLSDWNAAVQQAMKYKPINEGIVADS